MSLFHQSHRVYCGLFPVFGTANDFPLLNTRVHYDLLDVQAFANVVQSYTSNASIDAEINYVFPLPPDASVCAFKAVIDGKRIIKGVVKEKAKAKAEYQEAVSQGKTAALLQQDNVEIFQVSLGNIHPNQTIEVHISLACVIAHDGSFDSLRLTFPSAIAPRYGVAPNSTLDYSGNIRGWSHYTTHVQSFSSALDLSVAVQMTSQIKSVTSPSHPIAMKFGESTLEPSTDFDPTKARVSLSSPTFLEKDVVIVLSCQGLDKPRCMVESLSPEEGAQEYTDAYALTLVPRFELPPLPSQEYIFLVDRSGSMGGGKINAVRSALQIMLVSLPARGTSFNIISFGSRHSSLWTSSVPYSADSVKAASAHVDTMDADFGGTEIRSAIEAAFNSRSSRSVPASVFILTDGQAYDLDGVQSSISLAVAKTKADGGLLRVFCMGIGNAVSKAMCDVIARAGQGTASFVGEVEKPDQKLMSLLRAARGAIVEDLSIDWGVPQGDKTGDDFEMVPAQDAPKDMTPLSLFDATYLPEKGKETLGPDTSPVKLLPPPSIQQAPSIDSLPPLYPGFRTSLFAIIRRSDSGNSAPSKVVRIKGSVQGRPVQLEVAVTPAMSPDRSAKSDLKMIHILTARALVQAFEDEGKITGFMSEIHKAKVLRVAERYGIASSQTSFVAIDETGKAVDLVTEKDSLHETAAAPALGFNMMAAPASHSHGSFGFGVARPVEKLKKLSSGITTLFGAAPSPSGTQPRPAPSLFGGGGSAQTQQFQQSTPTLFGSASTSSAHGDDLLCIDDSSAISQVALPPGGGSLFGTPHSQIYARRRPEKRGELFGGFGGEALQEKQQHLSPTVESFARAQSFEGSFTGSPALYQLLVQQPAVPAMPEAMGTFGNVKETLWCTLLCVAYIEAKFVDEKDVWAMIVEKAMSWVDETLECGVGAENAAALKDTLKAEAKKCIV